jgi:hypothetical protein
MNKYIFNVKCVFQYEIDAPSEKAARKKLEEKGGLEIGGTPYFRDDAYKKATLDRSSFRFSEEDK